MKRPRRPIKRKGAARAAESPAERRARTRKIVARLRREFPEAKCALDHTTPLQLLVATILSAQCTDARVNIVTPALFAKYHTAADYAAADPEQFQREIQSTGFFRNKTKSILGMAQALVERHGGQVPDTMDALVGLPGVGRKTANVVLGNAFGKNEGIVVDTHVQRISGLLKLTRESTPEKIERDLVALVPRKDWTIFSHLVILHGRKTCIARRPKCESCRINDLCPSSRI
jgi:endonuclease III